MFRRRFIALGGAALAAPALMRIARADTFPSRFVRLVVPFPPGGAVDNAARIIANRLSEVWGQQMVVENKGGADRRVTRNWQLRRGVKIRRPKSFSLSFGGRTKVVSDRLSSLAINCIAASGKAAPSENTASGSPPKARSVKTATRW